MNLFKPLLITFIILSSTLQSAFAQSGEWSWQTGKSVKNQYGIYGTKSVPDTANTPGGRWEPLTWTDNSGNLWLFGGFGYPASGGTGELNDLWEFNPLTTQWTWIGGDSTINNKGIYGTKGTAASSNKPGSRYASQGWTDKAGNFWLYGGVSYDALSVSGRLSDLWKYSPASNQWTWVNGDSLVNNYSFYGSLGVPAAANSPGPRYVSLTWTDVSGNLWLFGGSNDTLGAGAIMNDLWKYDITSNRWTWMSGDSAGNVKGMYGTQGVTGTGNVPGSRYGTVGWADNSGNLWLYGGFAYGAPGVIQLLDDLWKFDPGTQQWTWMSGDSTVNMAGVYGTKGTSASTNKPGGRYRSVSWKDEYGNFWLFGGTGDYVPNNAFFLDDLWEYTPANNQWTWVAGDNTASVNGVYGTRGQAAPTNKPGSREYHAGWADPSGNLWLFGGQGFPALGTAGFLNDLWKYNTGDTTPVVLPVAQFTASDTNICAGLSVSFTDQSTGSPIAWSWTFTGGAPDTSSAQNPKVIYSTPGTYSVKLVVANAGGKGLLVRSGYITVIGPPVAGSITGTGSVCSGNAVQLSDTGSTGTLQWSYSTDGLLFNNLPGDTSTGINTGNLTQTTYYLVVATGVCPSPDTTPAFKIMVNPLPKAGVVAGPTAVCAGSAGQLLDTGSAGTLQWQSSADGLAFNNLPGDTSATFNTGSLMQTTYYRVTAGNSCGVDSSTSFKLTANPLPVPVVTAGDTIFCSGDSTSLCTTQTYVSYNWSTSDTSHCIKVNTPGNYWVTVTGANHCSAVSPHQQINNYPVPSVSIIHQGDTLSSFGQVSYQWLKNGAPIDSATGPVYVAHQSGLYAVQVTDSNGCITTSEAISVTTGLQQLTEESVSIFPNPSTGNWQLTVGNELMGSEMEVFDEQGRIVFQSKISLLKSKIDLEVTSGVYWLKISNERSGIVRKLIKL